MGPIAAALSTILTANMLKNLKLRKRLLFTSATLDLSDLTIAIPARNEALNLQELIPQIFSQSARPREVLILDDESEDSTPSLVQKFSLQYPDLSLLEGKKPAQGWRGKVWALQQLLDRTQTSKLLFLDADVRFTRPESLASLYLTAQDYTFTSVLPQAQVGASAALLVNQIYTHLYYFLPFNYERWKSSAAVSGSGQLMLVNVKALRDLGGMQGLSRSTHDGLKLARLFKENKKSVQHLDGKAFFTCRYYENFSQAFKALSRNAYEGTGNYGVSLAICGLLFWVFVLPFVIFPFLLLNPLWLGAFFFMLYGQFRMAEAFDLGLRHVLLTPVMASASIGVHLWSLSQDLLKLQSEWRGRVLTA